MHAMKPVRPTKGNGRVSPMINWREAIKNLPHFVPDFTIRPRESALVIVDMQNYGVRRGHGLGKSLEERYPEVAEYFLPRVEQLVIPNIQKLIGFYRKYGLRIVFVTVGPELSDGSDMYMRRRRRDERMPAGETSHFPKGTPAHQVIDELKPLPNELVVNKNSMGAFNSSGIDQLLRNMRITGLVVTGVGTNACVDTTARDAADRGYDVYLVEDACAAIDPLLHETTLLSFGIQSGRVTTTAETLAEFKQSLEV